MTVKATMPAPAATVVTYDEFRTGLSFREVRQMLWVNNDDPKTWRYKRRHTVLGFWHQLKQQLWSQYLDAIDGEANRG